ncbi:MAG: radical SAM protein [Bacteroidaceae bacterium]|nr:radical SAM protein [Bacteroidaceae bacterium]
MKLPIHHISISEANGPGSRIVVWVQGCQLKCKKCFNPMTHPFTKDNIMDTDEIIEIINNAKHINGVSFSGGEPLEYPTAIIDILKRMKVGLNSILFSGYTLEEVMKSPLKSDVVRKADLSILGRYNDSLPHPYAGKKFVLTTDAIDLNYFKKSINVEYQINGNEITKTGIFKL